MEDKDIKFTVNMKTGYIFEFLYINSYGGFRSVINYGFSAIAIVALIFGYGDSPLSLIALIGLASLFTVINPSLLLFKAWRQTKKNPGFSKPVSYTFNKSGITLAQDGQSQDAPWEIVLLAQETVKSIILFTGNNNATILPKACIGSELGDFKNLLREMCPAGCVKLKK
ncbi:MAG: YcxB family protein [Lachnospiraceae bacterium]|nr:YcxB family protein [Lachnospiraceae bacterium]